MYREGIIEFADKLGNSQIITEHLKKDNMNKKYIYIFTNTHSKDIVKIGKTDKFPEIRAEQLNRQTGTIGKYEVAWYREVLDNEISEKIIHYCLKELNIEKEYFHLHKQAAINVCEKVLDSYFAVVDEQKKCCCKKIVHFMYLCDLNLKRTILWHMLN